MRPGPRARPFVKAGRRGHELHRRAPTGNGGRIARFNRTDANKRTLRVAATQDDWEPRKGPFANGAGFRSVHEHRWADRCDGIIRDRRKRTYV